MGQAKRERNRIRKQQNELKKTQEEQKRVQARLRKQERSKVRKGELEKEKKKLRDLKAKENTIQNRIAQGLKLGYKALQEDSNKWDKKKKEMDSFLDNII